jgi:predicted O-methyltransferase YrrM
MPITMKSFVRSIPKAVDQPLVAAEMVLDKLYGVARWAKCPEARRIGTWNFGKLDRIYLTDLFPQISEVDVNLLGVYNRRVGPSLDPAELVVVVAVAQLIQAKKVLEVGTWDGNTALNLAANTPADARITTVDLPEEWEGDFDLDVPVLKTNRTNPNKTGRQFRGTAYESKIQQVLCDSAVLDWGAQGAPFDMVFIDGCHAYDYVKKDTENALRHVRKGGVVMWHDYGMSKEVSRAVDETSSELDIKAIRGTRIAVAIR